MSSSPPTRLQAPLPAALRGPQAEAHRHLIDYIKFLDSVSAEEWLAGAGQTILGYGFNVP
jgi:GH24 family phage-related lysozyme (muramidase)